MWTKYKLFVGWLVKGLAFVAGINVLVMMTVTCLDVILRRFGLPIKGAVDIVMVAACLTAVCALPYTTAVKGHVAVEFFFQRLPARLKPFIDGIWRVAVLILFAVMSWHSMIYGIDMLHRNRTTLTLHIPLFWILWLMSFSFAVVSLIKLYNLTHPGKEMMKP